MEYKYRVVALDGSIIYAGGSISGGTLKKSTNINLKCELENNKLNLEKVDEKIDSLNKELVSITSDEEIINDKLNKSAVELINLNSTKTSQINILESKEESLKIVKNDLNGITNLKKNNLDAELEKIMQKENNLTIYLI